VRFRNRGDAVLYVSNPPGIDRALRQETLDRLGALNRQHQEQVGDPEIAARISQYEMAFRMQASVPELTDFTGETQETLDRYGVKQPGDGSFAHPWATIGYAIPRAAAWDTIHVLAGTQTEHGVTVGKTLIIEGEGKDSTIVQAAAT
jgi:hypothetical protein